MFYIIENQFRPDGVVNSSTTGRSTLQLAQSYFYDRVSKMLVTENYTKVAIILVDSELNYYERKVVETAYVPESE